MRPSSIVAVAILVFYVPLTHAESNSTLFQLHARAGSLQSVYKSTTVGNGSFTLDNSLDVEAEYFTRNTQSFLVRSIVGLHPTDGLRYFYTGIGQRFYVLGSKGIRDEVHEPSLSLTSAPRWRYYLGWDAGLTQMLVIKLSSSLGSYATLSEASFCGGAIYQVSPNVGVDLQIGGGMGFGISTVSITAQNIRVLLGASIYF